MPVYTINGKRVTTDRELSDAEIDEIAADLQTAPAPARSKMEEFLSKVPVGLPKGTSEEEAKQRLLENLLVGAASVPVFGAVAKGAQLATQGTRAAKAGSVLSGLFTPKGPADLARQMVIGGVSGAGAGEFGQAVANKAGEEYRLPAEIVSGIGLGVGTNTLLGIGEAGVQGLINKAAGRKLLDSGNAAAEVIGGARASAKLSQAMEANPALAADLARSDEIFNRTGVRLPVTAASKGDTTLTGLVASQTSRAENAPFSAALKQQEKAAQEAVVAAQRKLAGDPRNAALQTEVEAKKIALENARLETAAALKQANINRQVDEINNRLQSITAESLMVAPGKADIGGRTKNLLDAREAILKQEFRPLYEKVLSEGQKAGVALDSPVVAGLWNFVKQRQADDVFAKFPALDSAIKSVLAPKTAPVSSKFAEKFPNLVRSAKGTFEPMDVKKIDSLKRAINKAIGQTKDDDQLRMLYELKNRFDTSLQSLPEDFVQAYKGLDKSYAEKIGIPFSTNGVLAVEKAQFVENVVPKLTNTPTAAQQILAATNNSPEAVKIIEDAFLMKISQTDSIVNKDTLTVNPAALQAFIRKNAETINQVPGLAQKLQTIGGDVATLLGNRQRLLDEQKNAAITKLENVWSKAYGQSGGLEGYVSRALNNPEDLNALLRISATDTSLQRGLKSVVLDLGLKSSNKIQFFDDNAKAINTLFGKDHAENVKALLEASERLARNPVAVKINQSMSQVTEFERLTGNAPERTASLIRQQVQSTFYKVSTLLSKFLQNKATKSESAEIQEFLLNPKNVKDMSEAIQALQNEGAKGVDKVLKVGKKLASNAATAALIGATAPARILERGEGPNLGYASEEEMMME